MRELAGLSRLAGDYDVLFCDIWGVIHDGAHAFAPACEALARWRETVGPVILISNSPRPYEGVAAQLDQLGAPRDAWTGIVTSGDASRALLAERSPGPVYRIGPRRDDPLFEGLGLVFADLESAAFIACSGPNDDEVETPEDYRPLLTRAAARKLPMICANPDILVQRGPRLIYCAGALAQLYEDLGGEVLTAGKPHAPIYAMARDAADLGLGRPADDQRILVIGDGLATDIVGANRERLDALLIGSGIHGAELVDHAGRLDLAAAASLLEEKGLAASWAMSRLAW
ncbi:MAG TPA: TIGR01459 family HAD-type hydrolase [Caulobacteraceae bacterium]|jgi:HAD superfamily hydrolase (TIGR01459 family)|nr:TIGR01459 family HAD-type hydrolase [Caulobacteraceae bacterium]